MFNLTLPTPEPETNKVSQEEKDKAYEAYLLVKKKQEAGNDLTLSDTKIVIAWARLDREFKFQLVPEKKKGTTKAQEKEYILSLMEKKLLGDEDKRTIENYLKTYKPKKLSKANMLLCLQKETLNGFEEIDLKNSLALYKGVKLSSKKLGHLLIKEADIGLNEIDKKDKNKTLGLL